MGFKSYLDGLMLSDGCITKGKKHRDYGYSQDCKYKEWLELINFDFICNNIETKLSDIKPRSSCYGKNITYKLRSNISQFFTEQHKRWYVKEYNYIDEYPKTRWHFDEEIQEWFSWRKIIPEDIALTPECILNLYLGDGSITKRNGNGFQIQLATDGFLINEVEYLLSLLNECVVNYAYIGKHSNNYTIYIGERAEVNTFFEYINTLSIPSCYYYKFPGRTKT